MIDPPDGKIPELTAEAKKRRDERAAVAERPAWGPEDRSVGERCILGFNAGPPINTGGYNQNLQIVQSKDNVVLLNEMVGCLPASRKSPLRRWSSRWGSPVHSLCA